MKLHEIVERYEITRCCTNGSCFDVGSKEYSERKYDDVRGFEIEEDFLGTDKTLKY